MKKHLTWLLIVGLFGAYAASTLRPRQDKGPFHVQSFASLPVVLNGRVQPLDSVAMNVLLVIRGNSTVPLEGNAIDGQWGDFAELQRAGATRFTERNWYQFSKHPKRLRPAEWLLEAITKPELADQRFVFSIDHPELKSELKLEGRGLDRSGLSYFSYAQLREQRAKIFSDANVANSKKSEHRNAYEKGVFRLANSMVVYERIKNSFQPENSRDFAKELVQFTANVKALRASAEGAGSTADLDENLTRSITDTYRGFEMMSALGYPFAVPPPSGEHNRELWATMGTSLTNFVALRAAALHPAVTYYASALSAYRLDKAADFNDAVAGYKSWLTQNQFQLELAKGERELFFNNYTPFKTSIVIYIIAFLCAAFSLFLPWPSALRAAFGLIALGLLVHTSGLIFRMVLEGRPPVTNLYSSAVFIGWGTVVIGLVIERFWKNGLGSLVASFIGVVTLIIAHNLSLDGDTMEMLQAVLDTNIWLATHVVVITLGYSAMFLAGFLGALYLVLGVFTPKLTETVAGGVASVSKALGKIVYGIVCFATLFSFVGTVLGGIWADQSWGRFWGWDPKENGALLIVIWCAVILHARWGGLIREKGLMVLAVFGNIVTAFSWFGVNLLGVGLHAYGFMEAAFTWLIVFCACQVLIMLLAAVPAKYWRSNILAPAAASRPAARPAPLKQTRPRPA